MDKKEKILCESCAIPLKILNLDSRKALGLYEGEGNPFGDRLSLAKALLSTVLREDWYEKIKAGNGFMYDGFAFQSPSAWDIDSLVDAKNENPNFYAQYPDDDLWMVGTNYDEPRFLIFPKSCLLRIVELCKYFEKTGGLPEGCQQYDE